MSDHQDQGLSRRKFLKTTAAGLTGLGVLAVAPRLASQLSGGDTPMASDEVVSTGSDPVVAYVRDLRKGEIVLMTGTKEVVRKDAALAAHLVRCCQV